VHECTRQLACTQLWLPRCCGPARVACAALGLGQASARALRSLRGASGARARFARTLTRAARLRRRRPKKAGDDDLRPKKKVRVACARARCCSLRVGAMRRRMRAPPLLAATAHASAPRCAPRLAQRGC
jgi:hypothetical protein